MTSTDSAAKPYTETLVSTDHHDSWSTAPNGSARCHDYYTVETWLQTWHATKYAGYTYKIVRRYISSSPERRGQYIGSSSSFHSGPESAR